MMEWPKTDKQILLEKIFYMRGHGLSQKEIGERLNITQQAVGYRLKQLRRKYLEGER